MALTPGGRSLDVGRIDAAYTNFLTTFNNRLGEVPSFHQRLATVVRTDAEVTTQLWLSGIPNLRKWRGPKLLKKFRGASYTIRTEPYEASVLVPKVDIMMDRYGMYGAAIRKMADAFPYAIDKLVADILMAGLTGTTMGATYDGQNLFDTDHAIFSGAAAQSNIVTGALSATTLATAFERFGTMKDEEGRPFTKIPRTLVVGYANRTIARKLIDAETIDGDDNLDQGIVDLIVTPYITGTQWFLFAGDPNAVIIHIRRGPDFLAVDDPSDSFVFDTANFKYGIEAEFGGAPGLWEDVVGGPGV